MSEEIALRSYVNALLFFSLLFFFDGLHYDDDDDDCCRFSWRWLTFAFES